MYYIDLGVNKLSLKLISESRGKTLIIGVEASYKPSKKTSKKVGHPKTLIWKNDVCRLRRALDGLALPSLFYSRGFLPSKEDSISISKLLKNLIVNFLKEIESKFKDQRITRRAFI